MNTIVMASDHAAFEAKEKIKNYLENKENITVIDVGCYNTNSCDYPLLAKLGTDKMKEVENSIGIFLCGSGIGISIAANRAEHIRAGLCHSVTEVRKSKEYKINVLCMGARVLGYDTMVDLVDEFLK